jgi:hypothetical protein
MSGTTQSHQTSNPFGANLMNWGSAVMGAPDFLKDFGVGNSGGLGSDAEIDDFINRMGQ